jgi:hypothetical protein
MSDSGGEAKTESFIGAGARTALPGRATATRPGRRVQADGESGVPGDVALDRRGFLLGLAALTLGALAPSAAAAGTRRTFPYRVDISMLWGVVRYAVAGSMEEQIDAAARRYRVQITGTGTGVTSRIDARGLIDDTGRHRPLEMENTHVLAGRESWLSITYDYGRGIVDYRSVGHTLLLGRRRQVDDVVTLPAGRAVDDAVSAGLNMVAGRLDRDTSGTYQMSILRRMRPPGEGPDDVTPGTYRVQVVPVRFRVEPDAASGKLVARVDMSGWSSWARPDAPAQLVFTSDRRLEALEAPLALGSTVRMRIG